MLSIHTPVSKGMVKYAAVQSIRCLGSQLKRNQSLFLLFLDTIMRVYKDETMKWDDIYIYIYIYNWLSRLCQGLHNQDSMINPFFTSICTYIGTACISTTLKYMHSYANTYRLKCSAANDTRASRKLEVSNYYRAIIEVWLAFFCLLITKFMNMYYSPFVTDISH